MLLMLLLKSVSVQDEMRQGLSYFHETIFSSLPVFQRRIDTALKNIGQPMLPLEHNLFHFGSWMGGDRDGNPFVTPETTREVVITARLSAVNLYFQQIEQLMFDLSTWRCNAELQVSTHLPVNAAASNKVSGLRCIKSQHLVHTSVYAALT